MKRRFVVALLLGCVASLSIARLTAPRLARNELIQVMTEQTQRGLADVDRLLGRIGKRVFN